MSCHTALITFTLALPRNFFFFFATILTLQGLLQIIEEHDLSDLLPDCFARIHNSELWHAVKALAKVTSQKSRSDPFVYAISINSIFGRGAGLLWKYFMKAVPLFLTQQSCVSSCVRIYAVVTFSSVTLWSSSLCSFLSVLPAPNKSGFYLTLSSRSHLPKYCVTQRETWSDHVEMIKWKGGIEKEKTNTKSWFFYYFFQFSLSVNLGHLKK